MELLSCNAVDAVSSPLFIVVFAFCVTNNPMFIATNASTDAVIINAINIIAVSNPARPFLLTNLLYLCIMFFIFSLSKRKREITLFKYGD